MNAKMYEADVLGILTSVLSYSDMLKYHSINEENGEAHECYEIEK